MRRTVTIAAIVGAAVLGPVAGTAFAQTTDTGATDATAAYTEVLGEQEVKTTPITTAVQPTEVLGTQESTGGTLPFTGAEVTGLAVVGAGALGAGVVLLRAGRRRHS